MNQISVAQEGGLLKLQGTLFGKPLDFVVDSGAALEGVLAASVVPPDVPIDKTAARLLRVGDGRTCWTVGQVVATVEFSGLKLDVTFAVMETTNFKALLGLQFLRKKEVSKMSFNPPTLSVQGVELPLNLLEETEKTLNWFPESYRLVDSIRKKGLEKLSLKVCVDLFANAYNHTETLFCCPRWSAWKFDWGQLYRQYGPLWCNPPFTTIRRVLCKAAKEGCVLVLLTPEWSGADWKELLDRLTVRRVALPPEDGYLFVGDHGQPLPAPSWTCVVSVVDSTTCAVEDSHLLEEDQKFIKKRSEWWTAQKLEDFCGVLGARQYKPETPPEPPGEQRALQPDPCPLVPLPGSHTTGTPGGMKYEHDEVKWAVREWLKELDGVHADPTDLDVLGLANNEAKQKPSPKTTRHTEEIEVLTLLVG